MKRWLIGMSLAVIAAVAQALPTVAEVDAEVAKGNYAQAESMMHEVVAAKPGSARAHYVYAEILAHNDRIAEAGREVALARQADPSLKFAKPGQFQAFETLLDRAAQRHGAAPLDKVGPANRPPVFSASPTPIPTPMPIPAAQASATGSGVPGWVWPVGLIALAFAAWRVLAGNRRASASGGLAPSPAAYGPSPTPYGAPPGYGPVGVAPSGGSGMMGVGLAAAGGVAAGMLAQRLLHGGHEHQGNDGFFDRSSAAGMTPLPDDSRALDDRAVDFGAGNDWDAGGDVGGSIDTGSGSGDGDSW